MEPQRDLVSHVTLFCRALRERGLLVGASETADALNSLGFVDILDRSQVYWSLRSLLVSGYDEIEAFDQCFQQFWTPRDVEEALLSGTVPADGDAPQRFDQRVRVAEEDGVGREAGELLQVIRTGASSVEVVSRPDLTRLRGDELAEVSHIAARIAKALPSRPGRRRRRHKRKGIPDLRSAFRLNLTRDGDIINLPRRRRVPRVPRLLVLLDVSGSMDRYANLLLQLVYALAQRSGRVETFVFSTSLTRVTRHLKAPAFHEALARIGEASGHWSGGTRIGECVAALNGDYPHLLDRSTSVFLLSDGWETGDPERLSMELGRLRKRVARLIWLNPLQGTPDYAPLTVGLQAARPHVDRFASALDLAHLKRLPRLLRR